MSKPVKALLRRELVKRLSGVDSFAVLSLTGVDGISNNRLRADLHAKDIRMTVVNNAVARQALAEVGLTAASKLLEGPCALAYGGDSIVGLVRMLLERRKDVPALAVKGALMEGEVFRAERIEALSKYPTRQEALARLVALALSPGGKLVSALSAPGGRLAGAIQGMAERAEQA